MAMIRFRAAGSTQDLYMPDSEAKALLEALGEELLTQGVLLYAELAAKCDSLAADPSRSAVLRSRARQLAGAARMGDVYYIQS